MVEQIFLETVKKYQLVEKKDKLIIAVSGGPDSMCLLNLFFRIKDEYKLYLVCAHFNHLLRQEANEEEEFVKAVCKDFGIEFISDRKDVKKFFKGDSLEQTARNLRYDFFLKCSREYKIKKIALAHHKDDVVETTLMRIIRGTALRGLQSMLAKSKFKGLTIIRPLIELRKSQILDWLSKNKISYKIDKSNFEDKFFRNKIRLKLLPILEEFNPNVVDAIFNLSKVASIDYQLLDSLVKEKFSCLKKQIGLNYIKLDLEELKKLDLAFVFNIIRLAIEELKGNLRGLEFRHFEEIADLLYRRPDLSVVNLPFLEVKKEDKWLVIKSIAFL